MTTRELAAPRGARDCCEGKTLEGTTQHGCGMKQGREAWACQETAERLRKPESGTEVRVDSSSHTGLAQGIS
jgi:hypothetical protein